MGSEFLDEATQQSMTAQHPDFDDEQAYIDHAYMCLARSREDALKMRNLTESGTGGTFQNRFERNAIDDALVKRLTELDLGDAALVFGRIDRFENEELESFTRSFFDRSPFAKHIDYRIADAQQELANINGPIDLVFIDADKRNYAKYFDLVIDKMRPGGLILVDNVLWSGKIIDPTALDKSTNALREFNQKCMDDSRVEKMLLPLRDGLYMLRVI